MFAGEGARKGPKVFLEGVSGQGNDGSHFPGESEDTPFTLEPMTCEPVHRTNSGQFPRSSEEPFKRCASEPTVDPVRPQEAEKKRRMSFRNRKPKKPIEVDRSSRKSLERVRVGGNLFSEDPEEASIAEDDMLERREFVVALMASLLKFGAATHLVENLMVSVAEALHIHSQCSAFPKMLFLTFRSPDRDPSKLQSRVLALSPDPDLGKLDSCDRLASHVAAKQVTFEEAKGELNRILMEEPEYHWAVRLFMFVILGSMATTLFYGGNEVDGSLAAVLGLMVGLFDIYAAVDDTFSR
eukprot:3448648-Rhodomonas_salina.1